MASFFHSNGTRYVNVEFQEQDIKLIAEKWKHFVNNIPTYPGNFEGRGIVICAGGINYFVCCWILVNVLRIEKKCALPIQVWYAGDEMTQGVIAALKELDVSCHNFLDYDNNLELRGWMLKPLAIKLCSFKEVLYLDADNIPVTDPEFLFQTSGYRKTGTVFWPDFWQTDSDNQIWRVIDCKPVVMKEQESGQLLINKETCWKELNLALFFNQNSTVYYNLLLGDKDTFRFAWLSLKSDFYFINQEVASCGYINTAEGMFIGHTMIQHTPDGQVCFLHRNLFKWDVTPPVPVSWQVIKRFKKDAVSRQYFMLQLDNRYKYINLEGDVETLMFRDLFGNIEDVCLTYLSNLRVSRFYNDFVQSFY